MAFSAPRPLALLLALVTLLSFAQAQNCAYERPITCLFGENATAQYEICENYICQAKWTPSEISNFCLGGSQTVNGRPCTNSVAGHFVFAPLACCNGPKSQQQTCLKTFSNSTGTGCAQFKPTGLQNGVRSSFQVPLASVVGLVTLALGLSTFL